jgi:tetratricopeptide (TPR) repeat protein
MQRMRWTVCALMLLLAACSGPSAEQAFEDGNRLFDNGALEAAEAAYSSALKSDPSHSRAFCNRGLARLRLGQTDAARADFAEAIRLGPAAAEAHYNRGISYLQSGDALRAMADFDDAVRLQTPYPRALAARGLARVRLGDRAGATADLKKALETASPDWPERGQVEAELARLAPK